MTIPLAHYIEGTGILTALARTDARWAEQVFDHQDLHFVHACADAQQALIRLWGILLIRAAGTIPGTVLMPGIGFVVISRRGWEDTPVVDYRAIPFVTARMANDSRANLVSLLVVQLVQQALIPAAAEVAEQERVIQFWRAFRRLVEQEPIPTWTQIDEDPPAGAARLLNAPLGPGVRSAIAGRSRDLRPVEQPAERLARARAVADSTLGGDSSQGFDPGLDPQRTYIGPGVQDI